MVVRIWSAFRVMDCFWWERSNLKLITGGQCRMMTNYSMTILGIKPRDFKVAASYPV